MEKFEYTQENLRKLQLIEVDMLKELNQLCRENNINYIIDAGTLLGAVRHGGFIPWDDDIDVRMLRADYDTFCEICKHELNENYFLQTYRTDKGYRWGYARILKNGTVFIRKDHQEIKSKNGIFLDVFPVDNVPDGFWGHRLYTCISWICRKMLYSQVGKNHANGFWNRMGFVFLDCFPKEWAYKGLETLSKRGANIDSKKVRCLAWGAKKETIGFNREWFEETCDIEFEGLTVKAPAKTHEFLVHSFGEDYMTPPPIEKRKPIHVADYIEF